MHAQESYPIPSNPSSPAKPLRRDAFQEPSSPTYPSSDRAHWAARNMSNSTEDPRPGEQRETFLEDCTPVEMPQGLEEGEDTHDLALSPKHIPRASMVDNMVKSLDQFSHGPAYQESTGPNNRLASMRFGRRRGHTNSSSVSSDGEYREHAAHSYFVTSHVRGGQRNSTAKQKGLQALPSIFGEDDDSARTRAYESQRAAPAAKPVNRGRRGTKDSKDSNASSIDLGHLGAVPGRLGPAGDRRSRSFDFGSGKRADPALNISDVDVAPNPVVFAGPEAQNSPREAIFHITSPLTRKNSARSAKSTHGRKTRAGTLGTETIKKKPGEPAPPMPLLPSATLMNTPSQGQPGGQYSLTTSSLPRPGFFRRVFGSKNVALNLDGRQTPQHGLAIGDEDLFAPPQGKLQKPGPRASTDVSLVKDNPATISKKASFFRRRKKSISNNVPPPVPLILNSNPKPGFQTGEASPVSSLRAFMDPYLADIPHEQLTDTGFYDEARSGSSHGFQTAHSTPRFPDDDQVTPTRATFNARAIHPPRQLTSEGHYATILSVPNKEAFLADSSSCEEASPSVERIASTTSEAPPDIAEPQPALHPGRGDGLSIQPRTSSRHGPVSSNQSPSREEIRTPLAHTVPRKSSIVSRQELDRSLSDQPATRTSLNLPIEGTVASPRGSASDISEYRSAPSTPVVVQVQAQEPARAQSPIVHVSHPSLDSKVDVLKIKALKIFENRDEDVEPGNAGSWLGEAGEDREQVRRAFMELFDWTGLNILTALRSLCEHIALKGESQQVNRIIDAFTTRWCESNSNHGFKSNGERRPIPFPS